ncbi:short-chain fatty acid transporter [Haloplanus halophilus]|uniref:short-chain fatty acid transporter n=1 Tax=Haloplanus halophilus TaxID=2949993 RepID=UPI00204007A3|nr:TIGR00366 family protein [Haloplanus sp. GDY1]
MSARQRVQSFGRTMADWSEKWIPSPFLFAVILTLIAYVAAIAFTPDGPYQNIQNWYDGFWTLLTFAMQMVLILVTGYAVADSDFVSSYLDRLASIPDDNTQAAALVAAVSLIFGYFHWGIGLIVGAIFAIFVARAGYERGKTFHYPILCAAGYTSQTIWHVGPSTSAGLLSATEGHPFEDIIGVVPLNESVFTIYAFGIAVLVFVTVVPVLAFLAPDEENATGIEEYAPSLLKGDELEDAVTDGGTATATDVSRSPADRINDSRAIAYLLGLGMMVYVVNYFINAGGVGEALDLNVFNFTFIALGLFLHKTPAAYMEAIRDATEGAAGIILQFPFYAGILGIISNSGLSDLIAEGLLAVATPETFPVIAWLLGGFMNLFVPSGGGEWGIIGGVVGSAAVELGVPPGKAIVAYGVGDMWTNMFQPFWAIPLLGLTQVRARDILGYTIIVMLALFPVFALGLYFLPY